MRASSSPELNLVRSACLGLLLTVIHMSVVASVFGQSLDHPAIWVTDQERPLMLEKIKRYPWAQHIFQFWKNHVDPARNKHLSQPDAILKSIPKFGGNQNQHNAILSLAANSGMLYFLTEDKSYAQLSADIIAAYSSVLASKTPKTTEIMGDPFFEGRTTYDQFALAYDFTYDFLKDPRTRVYDHRKGVSVPFDFAASQKALWNMAGNILQEYGKPDKHGRVVSNHPVLTAPGALFPLLCIEDDRERERLFDVFWNKGTGHQASFKNTLMRMYSKQGIWPESYSYSFQSNMIMILNIVDRLKPNLNVTRGAKPILEGTLILANLNNPDGRSIRYGDSKRLRSGGANSLRFIMHLSERRGYDDWRMQAAVTLKKIYGNTNDYKPAMSNTVYGSYRGLQLFWGLDIPDSVQGALEYRNTVVVEHAGIALARNFVKENNPLYGLNGYIGGAHYVHSHCTGIAMELYGSGYVMAPGGGLPRSTKERSDKVHTDYFRLYAGNNTVITNGTSHGRNEGSWKSKANIWQNTAVNIAAEPKHFQDPVSPHFGFVTQGLRDEVNRCVQQRTLSVVRTSETTGYYFDMFRALSLEQNNFHDYVYHNLGDETLVMDQSNRALPVQPTKRYDNDIGDIVRSPGWRFFENEKSTLPVDDLVKIRFHVKQGDRFMHMFVPGGNAREFTTALGPPTREALNGYDKKKTQILAIRQQGEAWKRPFICVFEPSTQSPSIQDVQPLVDGDKTVGAIVVSNVGRSRFTDFIVCNDSANSKYRNRELELEVEGHFAIVRVEESIRRSGRSRSNENRDFVNPPKENSKMEFYLGEGTRVTWRDVSVVAKSRTATSASVELDDGKKPIVTSDQRIIVDVGTTPRDRTSRADSSRRVKQEASERRRWSDVTGGYSVEASLAGVKQGKVALRKPDGTIVIVPLNKLSSRDRKFVKEAVEANSNLLFDDKE